MHAVSWVLTQLARQTDHATGLLCFCHGWLLPVILSGLPFLPAGKNTFKHRKHGKNPNTEIRTNITKMCMLELHVPLMLSSVVVNRVS